MRKLCIGLAAVSCVAALASPALAKGETVTGVLVDQSCYKMDKTNTGERHTMKNGTQENCATACAKMGQPVALVTTDGKAYVVTGSYAANKNEKLIAHMAHAVEVTGDVTTEKDGSMKIAVTSLKDKQQ
jgi:hypothetical protein